MTRIEESIPFDIYPLSETAIILQFGTRIDIHLHRRVKTFTDYLEKYRFEGFIECVPAFSSVTVYYDPIRVLQSEKNGGHSLSKNRSAYDIVCLHMKKMVGELTEMKEDSPREVEIPVCYGGEFGPDLEFVGKHNNLTPNEVIKIHSSGEYLVYMIGFAPGFPYLGGMSEKIAAPRRSSPRESIAKGSVGIAGGQTGVYPISTPGGWQLIGRTPVELFCPNDTIPSLLQTGDVIRFKPISLEEYNEYKEGVK
ncbi:inhibitor of KinA [Evansella vedderi]|uniref:Inhibitor of KinA n=1 Tax=Evansella vedderi TaxID=38282 RepID=A0ABT9ZNM9_9BACI|nr:5-oxoprolinase subunit PxpB [Evansella vedderi]MDQ0252841.1 inhibitor of KinA [Evansella vedderi]